MPFIEQEHTVGHEIRPGGGNGCLVFQRIIGQVNHVPAFGLVFRPGRIAGLNFALILQLQDRGVVFRHNLLVLRDGFILLLYQVVGGGFPERIGDHRLHEETADGQGCHQDGDDQDNRDSLTLFSLPAHGLHLPSKRFGINNSSLINQHSMGHSLIISSQDCKNPSFWEKDPYIRSGASIPMRYRPVRMTERAASARAILAAASAGSPSRIRCS